MQALFFLFFLYISCGSVQSWKFARPSFGTKTVTSADADRPSLSKIVSSVLIATSIVTSPIASYAAELYPLDKCFAALQKEVEERPSLNRIQSDIESEKWDDLKLFTREYDAGLRGSVMKSVWKQLSGEKKKAGIDLSNSFTFDLIGMNKAARKGDKEEALKYLTLVEKDLKDFLALKD